MNKLERWMQTLNDRQSVVVAFSGGVDSSVVAAAAHRVCGRRALAVTADSPSVPRWQKAMAGDVASAIGIRHRLVQTSELNNREYANNDRNRCFYCKQTLYQALRTIAQQHGRSVILSGTNFDDLGDYRPGIEAGRLTDVRTPLADLGIGKSAVRSLAGQYTLPNQDLPASPCLASRVAYQTRVTTDRLRMIEKAENLLRSHGFDICRVRIQYRDNILSASIEVPRPRVDELAEKVGRLNLLETVGRLGFDRVTIDRDGFRSGKLNDALEFGGRTDLYTITAPKVIS